MRLLSKKLLFGVLSSGVLLASVSCFDDKKSLVEPQFRKNEAVVPAKAQKVVAAAMWQIGKTKSYDPAYVSLSYPGGDIPIEKGVCTDVVIRALRRGIGLDLQELVHKDMKVHFSKYPKRWGLKRPDKNIDHRRVPNLRTYFARQGWSLPVSKNVADYKPGDLVTCTVGGSRPHIMIVSDLVDEAGVPMIIHNIGGGVELDPHLFTFPLTGHYRLK